MPAFVTVNDDRWQFIAGNKYFVIGNVMFTGTYTTGGIPLLFQDQRNPKPTGSGSLKASRAPWFAIFMFGPYGGGNMWEYRTPSDISLTFPPITTAGDINNGLLVGRLPNGTEFTNGLDMTTFSPVTGLFIFQGME
jgi:hypothetical protein